MKVYLVRSGGQMELSETIHAVFSTYEKAEDWIRANLTPAADPTIDEMEVDPAMALCPRCGRPNDKPDRSDGSYWCQMGCGLVWAKPPSVDRPHP